MSAEVGLGPKVAFVTAAVVDAEGAEPAVPVVVAAAVAIGKAADSPPERSSGTSAPPPTEGRMPAVPMRYKAQTERVLTKRNLWICWWNVAVVVLSLLAVWFNILVEHDVLAGTFLQTPPPPPTPAPSQSPTTCPFDVVACNRNCALMWVDCMEYNRNRKKVKGKKKRKKRGLRDCDRLHGRETHNRSTATFDSVANKTAYLESLDWVNEPILWDMRKEHVGNGRCERSGCGRTLCECNFDGGDCESEEEVFHPNGTILGLMVLSIIIYLCTMHVLLSKVIGYHFKAPKLRDEGELTAYVTKMQRAQPQVSFSVVCSHREMQGGNVGNPNAKTRKTVVTHRSSHPFAYAISTDASTLTKNWQQPAGAGGGEDGSLGTGFVAVVSSGLSWSAAKGVTADKLKAEKERLYEENKHHDSNCAVTVEVSLPGRHSTQLYAPAGAKFTKRLSPVAELLVVFCGLGAPLYFYYVRKLRWHVQHTVRKTIYIAGHRAPVE